MNPLVDDVVGAFDRVEVHPRSIVINRLGVVLPEGGHFQGIQCLPQNPQLLVITSDSDEQGFFVVCAMAADGLSGRARSPVTMAISPFSHAGGCQAFGHYLVAGVENDDFKCTSEVQFWDFRRFPVQLTPMTIPRSGSENVSTAGAVGLSSFGMGTALAVATYQAVTVDFYTSEGDPFRGSPFNLRFTWVAAEADKTGWIDQNWGAYQNVNLLTQTDGQLFMVGLHRNDNDEDWMDLYGVNMDGEASSALKKLAKKHMICTSGCNFDKGAGIFIPSSKGFEVYAINGDIGDPLLHPTIQANHFPSA